MSDPRSPYEEHRDDGIATECFMCHGYIHAGADPPFCKDCMFDYEIETSFNRMVRDETENREIITNNV